MTVSPSTKAHANQIRDSHMSFRDNTLLKVLAVSRLFDYELHKGLDRSGSDLLYPLQLGGRRSWTAV